LIDEYQILRCVILDVLHQNDVPLTHSESVAINSSIDSGIKEAVNAFLLIHAAFRERFVAALTHDLRAPVSVISMAAELILLTSKPEKIKIFAANISENTNRIDGMIQELLDSMAFHSGHPLKLDLSNFDICDVAKEVQAQSITTIGSRFEIYGKSVIGWWSRDAIKRALENMLSNAVKYGAPGTPIRIKTDEVYGRLLLSVHNEGSPIPSEEQENIFQIFHRAKSTKIGIPQGWGIGLPYVRSVAESHGGSIAVDSTLERGTTFLIDIPVDARPYQNAPTLTA